jgi:hypothetical protein
LSANSIATPRRTPRTAPTISVLRPASGWKSYLTWFAFIGRSMAVPKDLREFIESLNSHKVEYLIVGAHALAFHGFPRYTGDVDVLLRATPENAARVEQVLVAFSFASLGLRAADFLEHGRVVQLGIAPNRIDLLTSLTGVTFEEAWDRRVPGDLGGVPTVFLSRETLIKNKRATGRTQDAADVEKLEQ